MLYYAVEVAPRLLHIVVERARSDVGHALGLLSPSFVGGGPLAVRSILGVVGVRHSRVRRRSCSSGYCWGEDLNFEPETVLLSFMGLHVLRRFTFNVS